MKKNQMIESMNASNAARRKAEIAAGVRTDRRFVGKTIPNKLRKQKNKHARRELREGG